MEYRRRRRAGNKSRALAVRNGSGFSGVSRSYSRQRTEGSGFLGALAVLLLLGTLIYVLIATPVGELIVKKLFPDKGREQASPSPTYSALLPENTPTAEPSAVETETVRAELPGLDLYALQLGVYESAANAKGLINSLKSLGAAGYALASPEGVRILAACYTTEAAASSVRDRLVSQGYDCVVFPIRTDGVAITVTAESSRLFAVQTAAELSSGIIDDLNEEVIRFDTEERGIEYGKAIAGEFLQNIRSARAMLAGIRDPGGVVACIDNYLMEVEALASALASSETENRVEFSGQLKAFQLGAVERYAQLLGSLRSLAG